MLHLHNHYHFGTSHHCNHDDHQVYDMSSYVAVAGTPQVDTMKPLHFNAGWDLVFRILGEDFGISYFG